jgi:cytoplasmic tRNA 2-thiolation protein 2
MNDRTAQIREAVARYEGCEFIPVRLQDAFDRNWWERVSGRAASSLAEIPVDLGDKGSSIGSLKELSK